MANYSLKDVVLALRNEYVDRQKKLNKLKSYITFKDSSINDCVFIEHRKKLEKDIELQLLKNESALRKLYNFVKRAKATETSTKKVIQIAYELNLEERYIIVPNTNDYKITSLNELYASADKLMDSPFYDKIDSTIETQDKNTKIEFNTTGIDIITKETPAHGSASIRYDAVKDQICFTPEVEKFYSDQLLGIFDTQIPEELLADYHRDIVEKNNTEPKLLKVEGFRYSTNTQNFKIKDEDKTIILQGTKKETTRK